MFLIIKMQLILSKRRGEAFIRTKIAENEKKALRAPVKN